MKSTIVYDANGTIFYNASGNVLKPEGIPFMEIEIPVGKLLDRIDVSAEPPVPVFVDAPRPQVEIEVDRIKADNEQLKSDNEMLKQLVAELGLQIGGGL